MQPTDAFFLARGIEHLAVAGIGVFVIWLGYRLFRDMPLRREGEAKIALPGGISIFLSRVGPGVFFALFGAALVGYTATRPVSYQQGGSPGSPARSLSGLLPGSAPASDTAAVMVPQDAGLPTDRLVHTLAEMAAEVAATPMDARHVQRELALREARARLMLQNWNPGWGDAGAFRAWVFERGEAGPPPPAAAGAVALYRGGA